MDHGRAGHRVGTREQWRAERVALLEQEKELTRQRDRLAAARRELPWVEVTQPYRFSSVDTGASGLALADLFEGRGQLLIYHFMFGPGWEEGCPSCSFWADNYNGIVVHLKQRDVTLVAVSRAPLESLAAYRSRMGWSFPWYSSAESTFNFDYGVSFTETQQAEGAEYNFAPASGPGEEAPGLSAFVRGEDGVIYHTYSCYSRGLDALNGAYQLLDVAPRGRNEDALPWSMAWICRHDQYEP
ncbi:MAG: DUF899 domain-containing protein [Acidimicrobiales bacterium]